MVRDALKAKPGGQIILDEYDQMKTLMDSTRRQLVNLLVADMVEIHGYDFIVHFYTSLNAKKF